MKRDWAACLIHLRLNFQLMLAPIFLWGVLAAGGGRTGTVAVACFLIHVCLYGGATAFNSVFDRDDGPIGGLKRPPPVPAGLLAFSLALQVAGAAAALGVGPVFAALYLVMGCLGVAYSHPRWRLKARPWASILAVAFGQGIFGFFAGYAAAGGAASGAATERVVEAALIAALATTALYPLTQVYQADADRRRGDRTFAACYGARATFGFAITGTLGAGLLLAHYFSRYLTWTEGLLLGAAARAGAAGLGHWSRRYDPSDVGRNYDRVMLTGYSVSLALGSLILWHLARR
jgi:4-hydroxybenzoate polyprenyltransferase